MLNIQSMALIIAIAIVVIVIVVGVIMMTYESNYLSEIDSDEHIQKLDQYILNKIFNAPDIETKISELHTCQKLQLYGNLLAAENDLRYEDGLYGELKEPKSDDEQTKITDEFVKLDTANKKVFAELNCSDTHDEEWGTDEFYKFQSRLL